MGQDKINFTLLIINTVLANLNLAIVCVFSKNVILDNDAKKFCFRDSFCNVLVYCYSDI